MGNNVSTTPLERKGFGCRYPLSEAFTFLSRFCRVPVLDNDSENSLIINLKSIASVFMHYFCYCFVLVVSSVHFL